MVIALVWLSGAVFWWGFVGLGLVRFRRLLAAVAAAPDELQERVRSRGERMGLSLRRIPTVGIIPARLAPMVWAPLLGRPRLLLPQELWGRLDLSQQNAVLAHELAHLSRRDHWVRWFEAVVIGIYWWDPIAWWARREIERTEEEACDAWVLWSHPAAGGAYAEALVAAAAFLSCVRLPLPVGASGVSNTLSLKRRLKMIMSDVESAPGTPSRPWSFLALAVACLPLLPAPTSGKNPDSAAGAPVGQLPASGPKANSEQLPKMPPAKVSPTRPDRLRVSRPIIRQVSDYFDADSVPLQPAHRIDLKAAVAGILNRVACKPGFAFKKGSVLFEIDSRAFALEHQKAEAEVKRLQSRLRAISAQAQAIKPNEFGSQKAEARLTAEGEEAEALMLGAQATLDLAKLKLESTRVVAPIDGVVSSVNLGEGDFVEAGKTVLARILSRDLLTADVWIVEATAERLETARGERAMGSGFSIRIGVRDEENFPHSSSIDYVNPEAQNGQLRIRVLVPNADGSLRPGLMARPRVTFGPPHEGLLVPRDAIWEESRRCIYILNDKSIVERRFVQTGLDYDGMRVVQKGLRADEWVIIDRTGAKRFGGTAIAAGDIERIMVSPKAAEETSTP